MLVFFYLWPIREVTMRTARKTIALAQKIATRNFQLTVVMSSVMRFPKIRAGSEKVPMKVDRPLASTSLMKRNLQSVATDYNTCWLSQGLELRFASFTS